MGTSRHLPSPIISSTLSAVTQRAGQDDDAQWLTIAGRDDLHFRAFRNWLHENEVGNPKARHRVNFH